MEMDPKELVIKQEIKEEDEVCFELIEDQSYFSEYVKEESVLNEIEQLDSCVDFINSESCFVVDGIKEEIEIKQEDLDDIQINENIAFKEEEINYEWTESTLNERDPLDISEMKDMEKQSCRMSENINITKQSSSQPGTLSLKNENNKKLLKSLYDQKTVGQFCDVHFVVESKVVKVHACVLASFSSYMAQILENWKNSDDLLELHWCRKSPLKIHLNMIIEDLLNICYDCFTKIIDFMYLGHILIDSVHINHLEMITKKLKVNELISFCSRYRYKYKINLDANNSVVKVGSQIDKAKMKRKIAVVNDLLLKKKPKICVGSRSRTKRVYEQNSLCPNNSNTKNKLNRKRKNIAVTNNENNESSIKVSGFNNETIKNCFVLPNNVCEVNNILESTQLVTILPEANKKTDGSKRNKNIEGTIQKSGQLLQKPHAFTSCLNNDRRGDHTYCRINETELSHSLSTNEDTFSREQTDVSKLGELMSKGNRKTEPCQVDVTSYSVVEVSQISDKQLEQNPPSTSSKDKINHTYSNVSLNVNIPKSNEKCAFKETIQFSNVVNTQEISKITNNKDKHTVTCSKSKQTDCSINDVVPKANEIIETSQGNEDNRISKPNYTTSDEGATEDNCETSVNRKIYMLLEKKDTKDEMITKQIKSVLSEEETKVDKSKKHMERCIFDGKSKSGVTDKETKTESNSFNTEKKMDRYRYSCTFCPFQSGKVQNLVTHMMHNNHEYTECLVCNYKPEDKSILMKHLQNHLGPKPFFCYLCKKNFITRTIFEEHNRSHLAASFACNLCSRTFKYQGNLKTHILLIHKKVILDRTKPSVSYKCPNAGCGFETVRKFDLRVHKKTHDKEKAFQCDVCERYFSRRQHLVRHKNFQHSTNACMKCDLCEYTAKRNDKLLEHYNNSLLTTNVTCNNASKEMSTEIQSNIHGHSIGCTIRPNEGFYSSRDEMNHENSSDLSDQQKEKCKITTKQSESKYSKNDDSLTDKNHALLLPENNTQIKQNSLINLYVIDDTVLNSYKRVETTCTSDTISDQMDILNEATGELLTIGVNTFSDFHDQYSNKENPDLTNKISTQNNIILHNPVLNPKSNGQESTSVCEKGDMVNLELENNTRNICDENDDLNNETCTENNIEESIYHCCANSSKRTCLLNKMVEDETFDSCTSSNKFRDRPKSNADRRKSDPVINWYEFNSDIFSLASQSNKVNYVYLISKELSPDEYILNEHTGNIIFPTPFLNEGTGELSVINMTIDPAQFINMGNFEINETNTIDTQSIASDDNTTDDIYIEQSLATNTIVNTPFEPPESENNSNSGGNFLNELTGELRKQYFNKNICTESTSNESIDVSNINKYSVLDETTGELLENKNEEFDKCLNNKSDPVINWYNFNSNILSLASQSNKVNYVYLNTKELSPDEYILNEQTGNIIFPAPFLNEGTGELSVINMTIDPMQFINMGNFEINETNNTDTQSITSDDNTTDDVNIEQSLASNTILNAPIEPPESEENCNNGGIFLNELTGELCEKYLNKNICTESTSNGSIDVSNINKYSVLDEATGELLENKNTEFNESLIKETDMIVLNEMTGEISTNTTQSDSNNLSVSNSWNDWFFDSFQDDSIDSFPLEKRMFSDDIHLDELLFNENDRRDSWKARDNESADILLNESTGELVKKD